MRGRLFRMWLAAGVLAGGAAAAGEADLLSKWPKVDANRDGRISRKEFPGSERAFAERDLDGNGGITRQEIARHGKGERAPEGGVRLAGDVTYGRVGKRELKMDILLPPGGGAKRPAILWIHGGGWRAGDKRQGVEHLSHFAGKGYVVATMEYRLIQEADFPAQIQDCKCAVRFLRAHAKQYGIDPDRIGVWGSSAGGHLAALLGTSDGVEAFEGQGGWPDTSSRVQAVCDWFGPADLYALFNEAGVMPRPARKLRTAEERRSSADEASPIAHASAEDPPFLIMHGTKDRVVPFRQSYRFKQELEKKGVAVEFVKVKGADHGDEKFKSPENLGIVLDFFNRTLSHDPPAEDRPLTDSP